MKRTTIFAVVIFVLPTALWAQRASMESPIIKSTPDAISFTANFSQLDPNGTYRIGVGASGTHIEGAQLALQTSQGAALPVKPRGFKQGHASSWWGVSEIAAQGFDLVDPLISQAAGRFVLRFQVPRSVIDRLQVKSIYVFVAKKYGPETWYLEDGAELSDQYW